MKVWANKWWFALFIMVVYIGLDVCSSIATFASNMRDDMTWQSMTLKECMLLVSGVLGSMFLCIKTYVSTTFHKARNGESTIVK